MDFKYDFNAPQNYFDLKDQAGGEPDDTYFDCTDAGSGPVQLKTPQVESSASKPLRPSSRQNVGTPRSKTVGTPRSITVGTPKSKTVVGTPGRPLKFDRTPKKPSMPMETEAVEDSEDKENAHQTVRIPQSAEKRKSSMSKRNKSLSPTAGVRSSPRLVAIAKALRRTNAARRSAGSGSGSRRSSSSNSANLGLVHKQKTQNKPVPKVPDMNGLNVDDLTELAAITTFKQKIVSNKKKGESMKNGRLNPTVPHEFNFATDTRLRQKNVNESVIAPKVAPLKATRHGPTRPQEFHFATNTRIKRQASTEEEEAKAFPQSLRSGSSVTEKEMPKGPTIPQPFNLTETRKGTGSENKFVSVAELNMKFHTRTPQRFRSKRLGGSTEYLNQNNKKQNSGVTIPVTPNLSTKTRSRQANYLTREEMEQKEFEEAQKHKFRAQPLNKKVFDPPADGYQVDRKASTMPDSSSNTKKEEGDALLGGSSMKGICKKLGCSSSDLATLPWGGVPTMWDKPNTKLQPFSFDTRDKKKMQRKKEMIMKILEDEKKLAEFQAQPMPVFEEGIRGVPLKKPPTPTRLQPFNLLSDQRGEVKKEQIQRGLEEEERLDKVRRTFHAQSDAILHQQPFIPEKSKKSLTDISGFTLNTEVRAEARTEFEFHQKQKEDELLAAKLEREARQAAEEAAEIAQLRREVVHKANPVRNFKLVEIKPAPHLPTIPVSPNFATKSRLRSRVSNNTANSTMNVSSATFTTE